MRASDFLLLGVFLVLVGFAITQGDQQNNCREPSARSVIDLFAPCLAQHADQKEIAIR